jgi:uncharacterized protein with NAD-binding domain and iron-sulfur cluster
MAKKKIAILGGGVGAMATAFGLTSQQGWQDEYEITVYQLGWRLGGKGASGRNAAVHQRIEEHGLHMWFGFYENAFATMRLLYREIHEKNLAPGSPFQSWTDAFHQQTRLTQMEKVEGQWQPWSFNFPIKAGEPGDGVMGLGKHAPPEPWDHVLHILDYLVGEYERVTNEQQNKPKPSHVLPEWAAVVLEKLTVPAIKVKLDEVGALHLSRHMAHAMNPDASKHLRIEHSLLVWLLHAFRKWLFDVVKRALNWCDDLRHFLIVADMALAVVVGLIEDRVLTEGFPVIDRYDAAEWLGKHGCVEPMNPLMRSMYDGCFAYADGDPDKPTFSAASAIHGMLRVMFTYRGSVVYRMAAGMGDTIFGPFYLVLKNRGVKFEFFQRVKNLKVNGHSIDAIDIDVQATLKNGEYDPLVPVKGLPCWPNQPLYDQLVQGDELKPYNLESAYTEWHDKLPGRILRRDLDFDQVVLGISLGALPFLCKELIQANQRWQDMVTNMTTLQTKGLQLWLHKTAAQMGWDGGENLAEPERALCTSYVEVFDTYCDFSHLIPMECWTPEDNIQQIAYFCNAIQNPKVEPPPFTDPNFPAEQCAIGQRQAADFLSHYLAPLWPKAVNDEGGLDPSLVATQYLRVNVDPSERYVPAPPDTARWRMLSGESGFDNLTLAGDWTYTDINGGCVEAAVTSGMMACAAIVAKPIGIYTATLGMPAGFQQAMSAQMKAGS